MIFEFVVAALVFFVILFYILSFLGTSFDRATADVVVDSLTARLVQLSSAIVEDGIVNASFINATCWAGRIDGKANFNITTTWQNGTPIQSFAGYNMSCGRPAIVAGMRRVGLLDGQLVVVELSIW